MIWLKFIGIQLVMLLATVLGWFLLLPFCVFKRWTTRQWLDAEHILYSLSIKDTRVIDHWNSILLNVIYGNPEDGVSGKQALVWADDGSLSPHPYMAMAPDWWRAYCWSAWRNSCDNLKYVFANDAGPLKVVKIGKFTVKVGWQKENGFNVPVLSVGH